MSASGAQGQIALPLGWSARPGNDAFIVTPSNARAAQLLDRWAAWPVRAALLIGPPRSGRSLLARIFASRSGGTVIDDARTAPQEHLFHAWNRAQTAGRPLLIVADAAPPAWTLTLPDLHSRLAASPVAEILPPDDALVAALLEAQFVCRGLVAPPDLVAWLMPRIERTHLAVLRAVELLDAAALGTRRRLTVTLARDTLVPAGIVAGPELA